jgi:hypothetical protein
VLTANFEYAIQFYNPKFNYKVASTKQVRAVTQRTMQVRSNTKQNTENGEVRSLSTLFGVMIAKESRVGIESPFS